MSTENRGNLAKLAAEFRAKVADVIKPHREAASQARATAKAEAQAEARKRVLKMSRNENNGPLKDATDAEFGAAVDSLGASPIEGATDSEIDAAVSLAGESSAGEAIKRFETGQSPVESRSAADIRAAGEETAADLQAAVRQFEEKEEAEKIRKRIEGMKS